MNIKNKLKVGFGTLAMTAFMTVGPNLSANSCLENQTNPEKNTGVCRQDKAGVDWCYTSGSGSPCAGTLIPPKET